MPFIEIEPWCEQYVRDCDCPPGLDIALFDADVWPRYPAHRFVYNKLFIAESQDIPAAAHGVMPPAFPVFSKPVYNLQGMGAGSAVIEDVKAYEDRLTPGHMWMVLLSGDHVSSDVAVLDGVPVWWRHTRGRPLGDGMFDYWEIFAAAEPALEDYCGSWIRKHLRGFTGIANIETIGGIIIEAHLRMTTQWLDLYGAGWVDAAIGLYAGRGWRFDDTARRDGYSVILFGAHGRRYRHPSPGLQAEVREMPGISSLQITFFEDIPSEHHAMPPGGFRLAVVNCHDLAQGRAAREKLRAFYAAESFAC